MSSVLLSKPKLPDESWIDVSVGEPHTTREALFEVFNMDHWEMPVIDHQWEYPPPVGYKHLVDLLEWKHNAPVVITNGAKQALGATFYALKKMGKQTLGMKLPFWALIPPLLDMHGLEYCEAEPGQASFYDSYLLLAPNNPDGTIHTATELKEIADTHKADGLPFIHDAAYYTHSYLPAGTPLPAFGDVQIYSISKMLGLSNLRVGYAVCPNKEFYGYIKQYVEATTVGVSLPSQTFAYELMNHMRGYPTLVDKFEGMAFQALQESKKIIKTVSQNVLEVPSNLEETPGMFGWFKTGPAFDQEKFQINFIDGALFGVPGYVRMNLSFSKDRMEEIVKRLWR